MSTLKVPLPLLRRDIGLGGFVKKGLSAVGVKPCGGCGKRAAALDKAVTFKGKENGR